uniref:Uncharacterized protein n=1 Tax=Nelumbo nucifera TaxID=4432 RepID=A0A822ZLT7_NELNU|nr:TPA_asm: hypothetical protein HUJ06_003953 [Nelumbo nucifera]
MEGRFSVKKGFGGLEEEEKEKWRRKSGVGGLSLPPSPLFGANEGECEQYTLSDFSSFSSMERKREGNAVGLEKTVIERGRNERKRKRKRKRGAEPLLPRVAVAVTEKKRREKKKQMEKDREISGENGDRELGRWFAAAATLFERRGRGIVSSFEFFCIGTMKSLG